MSQLLYCFLPTSSAFLFSSSYLLSFAGSSVSNAIGALGFWSFYYAKSLVLYLLEIFDSVPENKLFMSFISELLPIGFFAKSDIS